MKKNNYSSLYSYTVFNISEGNEIGFQAVIPKFPKIFIVADTPAELHEVVQIAVKEEIADLKKKNKPIPKPDYCKYSGKFILRLKPEVHEKLSMLSKASGKTLNQYLNNLIEEQII